MKDLPVLLILNFHSLASRNFFTTSVAEILSKLDCTKVVILVPDYKLDFFKSEFSFLGFEFIGVNNSSITNSAAHNSFVSRFINHLQQTQANSNRHKYLMVKNPTLRTFLEVFVHLTLFKFLSFFSSIKKASRAADKALVVSPEIQQLFEKIKPSYVYSTDVFGELDALFTLECNRRNIPVMGMVRSWDNPVSKGLLRGQFEKIIVNNLWIRDQMVNQHACPKKSVEVVGTPQFDMAFNHPRSRENFMKEYNIPSHKKIILFGGSGYLLDQLDKEICQILLTAKNENKFEDDVIFVLRPHPSSIAYFKGIDLGPDFIMVKSGQFFETSPKNTELTVNDQKDLLNILASSDVMVYTHTTLSIDALPFNLPQVVVCFPGLSPKKKWHDPLVYHKEEHFSRFMDTGASLKVFDKNALIKGINIYLRNPALHTENRKKAIIQEIYSVDADGGKNVAGSISDFVKLHNAHPL